MDAKDFIVEKSRELALANFTGYGKNELRLLDIYLSRINARDPETRFVQFTKQEYCEIMGLHEKTKTKDIESYLQRLRSREVRFPVTYKNKSGIGATNLFTTSYILRDDVTREVIIVLKCNEDVKDLFFNLEKNGYLRYVIRTYLALESEYSMKLYNQLRARKYGDGKWSVAVELLREVLELKGKSYDEFKYVRRVIDESVRDINEHTDIQVSYEITREWRTVKKLTFLIRDNEKNVSMALFDNSDDGKQSAAESGNSEKDSETETDDTTNGWSSSHRETLTFLQEACEKKFTIEEVDALLCWLRQIVPFTAYESHNQWEIALYDHLHALYIEVVAKREVPPDKRYPYLLAMLKRTVAE